MSRESGGYDHYHTSRSSSQRNLPPIRDVVGDVLEQPARPRPVPGSVEVHTSRRQTYPTSTQGMRNTSSSHLAVQLPPLRSRSTDSAPSRAMTTSSIPRGNSHTYSPSYEIPRPKPARPEGSSTHSYDVFTVASGQGLVHQRRSNKDDFRQSTKEEAIATSTGRYICPDCSRRFEKLSHFKNHLTSHSGEKPYECPSCGKTFSASSNMRRHQRTHALGDGSSETQNR